MKTKYAGLCGVLSHVKPWHACGPNGLAHGMAHWLCVHVMPKVSNVGSSISPTRVPIRVHLSQILIILPCFVVPTMWAIMFVLSFQNQNAAQARTKIFCARAGQANATKNYIYNRPDFVPVAWWPKEDISARSRLLIPISESFAQRAFSLFINTFCGFRSRWIIPSSCKWTSPQTTSLH